MAQSMFVISDLMGVELAQFCVNECCVVATVVSVINDQWCWKSKSIDIEVIDKDLMSVDFTQTGFMLSASLSHSILLVNIFNCWICSCFLFLQFFS